MFCKPLTHFVALFKSLYYILQHACTQNSMWGRFVEYVEVLFIYIVWQFLLIIRNRDWALFAAIVVVAVEVATANQLSKNQSAFTSRDSKRPDGMTRIPWSHAAQESCWFGTSQLWVPWQTYYVASVERWPNWPLPRNARNRPTEIIRGPKFIKISRNLLHNVTALRQPTPEISVTKHLRISKQ